MRIQQEIWRNEHAGCASLPKLATEEPSSGVVWFVEFLRAYLDCRTAKAVDIGTGKGRNAIYLGQLGCNVLGLEYIKEAVLIARQRAQTAGLGAKVRFVEAEMDAPWTVQDNTFDLAVDSFASIDIETHSGRVVCRDEMYRTLRPGGYALVTVCSVDDEFERELMAKNPGPEPNSSIWPETGKFQKNYDEEELRDFYSAFDIQALKKVEKPATKLGRQYLATNLWMIARKPIAQRSPIERREGEHHRSNFHKELLVPSRTRMQAIREKVFICHKTKDIDNGNVCFVCAPRQLHDFQRRNTSSAR